MDPPSSEAAANGERGSRSGNNANNNSSNSFNASHAAALGLLDPSALFGKKKKCVVILIKWPTDEWHLAGTFPW